MFCDMFVICLNFKITCTKNNMAETESSAESFGEFHEEEEEYMPSESDNKSTDTDEDKLISVTPRKRKAMPKLLETNILLGKGKTSVMENRSSNEIINLDKIEESCTLAVPIEYAMNTMQLHSSKIIGDREVDSAGILQDENIGSTSDNIPIIWNTSYGQDSKSGKTVALIPIDCLNYCNLKDGKLTVQMKTLHKLRSQNSVYLCNTTAGDGLNKNCDLLSEKKKISNCSDFSTLHEIIRPRKTDETSCNDKVVQSLLKTNTRDQSKVVGNNESLISTNTPNVTQKLKPNEINSLSFQSNMKETQKCHSVSSPHNRENFIGEYKTWLSNKRKRPADNGNVSTHIDSTKEQDSYVKANMNHTSIKSPYKESYKVTALSQNTETKILSNQSNDISTLPYTKKTVITSGNSYDKKVNQKLLKTNAGYQSEVFTINNTLISTNTPMITQEAKPEIYENFNFHNPDLCITESENHMLLNNSKKSADNGSIRKIIDLTEEDDFNIVFNVRHTSSNSLFRVRIPYQYIRHKDGQATLDSNIIKRVNEEILKKIGESSNYFTQKMFKKDESCNEKDSRIFSNQQNFTKSVKYHLNCADESRYFFMNGSDLDKFDLNGNSFEGFNQLEVNFAKSCFQKFSMYLNSIGAYYENLQSDLLFTKSGTDVNNFGSNECSLSNDLDKFDLNSNSFKGFNQLEVDFAKSCFQNFSMYLNSIEAYYENLQSDLFITKSGTDVNNFGNNECSLCNDLYFTNKIDILDQSGRKVRTEHVYNDQTQVIAKKQKLENSLECMLIKMKPFSIVLERNEIVEERINEILKQQEIRKKLDANFLKTSTTLTKDLDRPTIILNEKNFQVVKLDENFCTKGNVIFLKNDEDDFSESLYKNKLFIQLVEQNLIKITSPSVLQDYLRKCI